MKQDASTRNDDVKVIALLAVMVVGLVGLIAILLEDPSIDASRLHPIGTAHAAAVAKAPRDKAVAVDAKDIRTVTPEENWAADESSHGMRPDAAH